MSQFCASHRMPRAGIDPVDTPATALAVVRMAMSRPLRPETIVLVLDGDRCGRTIVVVDGTESADAVSDVVERVTESMADTVPGGSLVVASVRPGGGPDPDDADRWLEISDLADDAGVELLEWFVVADDVGPPTAWCPA